MFLVYILNYLLNNVQLNESNIFFVGLLYLDNRNLVLLIDLCDHRDCRCTICTILSLLSFILTYLVHT